MRNRALELLKTHAFLPHFDSQRFSHFLFNFNKKLQIFLISSHIGETRLRSFVSDLLNTCSANSCESTISSVRTYAFRASCMSKARYRANVNAFEQNKGRETNTALWTSDRSTVVAVAKKKKKSSPRSAECVPWCIHILPFLIAHASDAERGEAFIAASTDTMRHGRRAPLRSAQRDAMRRVASCVLHAGHGNASE